MSELFYADLPAYEHFDTISDATAYAPVPDGLERRDHGRPRLDRGRRGRTLPRRELRRGRVHHRPPQHGRRPRDSVRLRRRRCDAPPAPEPRGDGPAPPPRRPTRHRRGPRPRPPRRGRPRCGSLRTGRAPRRAQARRIARITTRRCSPAAGSSWPSTSSKTPRPRRGTTSATGPSGTTPSGSSTPGSNAGGRTSPSRRGEVASLLVVARRRHRGGPPRALPRGALWPSTRPTAARAPSTPSRATRSASPAVPATSPSKRPSAPTRPSRAAYRQKTWLLNLVWGAYSCASAFETQETDWAQYPTLLRAATDFRKFDDTLRMVLSGSAEATRSTRGVARRTTRRRPPRLRPPRLRPGHADVPRLQPNGPPGALRRRRRRRLHHGRAATQRATRQGLRPDGDARRVAAGPRPLEVEPADAAVHVAELAAE